MTDPWEQFYRSRPRQLVALSRYLQGESMAHLKHSYGHRHLRLHFQPYMFLLSLQPRRVTELAELLSLSKQACNQVADRLEALRYVQRKSDARDGRAKLLTLTAQGKKLVEDGIRTARVLDERCLQHLSLAQMQRLQHSLRALSGQERGDALLMLLPRFGDRAHQHFLNVLMQKHPRLKPAHLEMFTMIGGCAGQLKRIAQLQEVTLPAVQQLAKDLEQWSYVNTDADKRLQLTRSGEKLVADAIAADAALEAQWHETLGEKEFAEFRSNLNRLYEALQLPEKMLGQQDAVEALARTLREQLSAADRQRLAGLLRG